MIYLCFYILTLFANAQVISNDEIVNKSIPRDFFSLESNVNVGTKLLEEEVSRQYVEETFKNSKGVVFLIANYNVYRSKAKMLVIQVNRDRSFSTTQDVKSKLNFIRDVEFVKADLDGDGINEIIKNHYNDKGDTISTFIYKWTGEQLVDITPIEKTSEFTDSLFRNLEITKFKVNGKPLLIETGENSTSVYQLNKDNNFASIGSYNFLRIFEKKNHKPLIETVSGVELTEGTYTLEVKNISNHKHAVRAEISVNGNIVLKPEDFCTEKPKKKFEKRKDKHGKFAAEDDDDDQDEDGCKRCQMKKDVYADVRLNATNTISVKLYGNKHSRIQVTLKKKN